MNWKIGKHKSTVVSDTKVKNTNFPVPPNQEESDDSEVRSYGGYLIAESIGNIDHAKLIAAAPDMLEALIAMEKNYKDMAYAVGEEGLLPEDTAYQLVVSAIKKATE